MSAIADLIGTIPNTETLPALPTPPVPDPTTPPLEAQALKPGQIVEHVYAGPRGPVTQTGVVREVLEGDRVTVAWFANVSGPMATADLAAV